MATINEKLADMLATVKELRKSLQNTNIPNGVFEFIETRDSVTQEELFDAMPTLSPRTMRRRLDDLLTAGKIIRKKEGRYVRYHKNPDYPQ